MSDLEEFLEENCDVLISSGCTETCMKRCYMDENLNDRFYVKEYRTFF